MQIILDDSGRHRRLGVRALAREFLSQGTAARARTRPCQPEPYLDRDQCHVLRLPEARELPPLGRGHAGRLCFLLEGAALCHPSESLGGGQRLDRTVLREWAARIERK